MAPHAVQMAIHAVMMDHAWSRRVVQQSRSSAKLWVSAVVWVTLVVQLSAINRKNAPKDGWSRPLASAMLFSVLTLECCEGSFVRTM